MPFLNDFHRTALVTVLSVTAAAAMVACQPAAGAPAAAAQAAPLPVVAVAAVQQRLVEPVHAHVGRVEAAQRVEIRPRVAGHIAATLYREGELVAAGQPLFRIDPRPFEAALARSRAELQLAQAREGAARGEALRAQQLAREQAIAAEELERRNAAWSEAQARVAAAQAAVQAAALDHEFALVKAPVAGRMGRALVSTGNFVAAGAAQPPLAVLAGSTLDVHFDINDAGLIRQFAAERRGGRWSARILDAASGAELARAPIDFVDNEINPQASTLRLRARIEKAPAALMPGQHVRVQLAGAARESLLVPDKAIGSDQAQRYVLVVKDGALEYRKVRLGALHGDERIVDAGLAAGEQVVAGGLMKLRAGMKVQTQAAAAAAQAAASQPRKS